MVNNNICALVRREKKITHNNISFLVSFTPEQAKSHFIDIKFNGETVNGCPFVCAVADTSRVLLNLSNLGTF